jgi:Na+-translocating ferredoxin:NAD+ oxidoreductase subunit B
LENKEVYRQLSETLAKRGGPYPGMDMPEFYPMAEALFTPAEAAISNLMPEGIFTLEKLLPKTDMTKDELVELLKGMAPKGLCFTIEVGGTRYYNGPPFVPGIMEWQFMHGEVTDEAKKIAKLVHTYMDAVDVVIGSRDKAFPDGRVIPINQTVEPGKKVRTYNQIMSYIDNNDLISVATCYCRHGAKLLDENDVCDKPMEVCMQFGPGAKYVEESGVGRVISKEEAKKIILETEKAGLIHCTMNTQDISFVCNCCKCHCMGIEMALRNKKPSKHFTSGYKPVPDSDLCVNCGTCVDICPSEAISFGNEDLLEIKLDRCFGCGLCVGNCEEKAISMTEMEGYNEPPANMEELKKMIEATEKEVQKTGQV